MKLLDFSFSSLLSLSQREEGSSPVSPCSSICFESLEQTGLNIRARSVPRELS